MQNGPNGRRLISREHLIAALAVNQRVPFLSVGVLRFPRRYLDQRLTLATRDLRGLKMLETKDHVKELAPRAKDLLRRIGLGPKETKEVCLRAQLLSDFKDRDYISESDIKLAWAECQAAALDNPEETGENQDSWFEVY
jgi:hypothetical protein